MCKVKVLIIDDNSDNLTVFDFIFRSFKKKYNFEYDLTLFKYPDKGISDLILKFDPDIVFLDIKMPYIDGIDILNLIRALGYNKPVIAQTSSATDHEIEKYKQIFQDGIITKPIDISDVFYILSLYHLIDNKISKSITN